MMTRRAFSLAGLWTGVLALFGLTSCESDAPVEGLVAGEDLFYASYSRGGGMDGGSDAVELVREDCGGRATRTYQEACGTREKTREAKVDASVFDEFDQLIGEFDLRAASEQPDSEFIALDAPTTTVTFAYADGEGGMDVDSMFSVSTSQDLSYKQREGFWATVDALEALVPS